MQKMDEILEHYRKRMLERFGGLLIPLGSIDSPQAFLEHFVQNWHYFIDFGEEQVITFDWLKKTFTSRQLKAAGIYVRGTHHATGNVIAACEAVVHHRGWGNVVVTGTATLHAGTGADITAYRDAVVHVDGQAEVDASHRARVHVRNGSTEVHARDSVTVTAHDSAEVFLHDRCSGVFHDTVQAEVMDRCSVRADGDAYVRAYDKARVNVSGRARVQAGGTCRVTARDRAEVSLSDWAHCTAKGQVCVSAADNTRAECQGDCHVTASDHSVVTLCGGCLTAYGKARAEVCGITVTDAFDDTSIFAYGKSFVSCHGPGVLCRRMSVYVDETLPVTEPTEFIYVLAGEVHMGWGGSPETVVEVFTDYGRLADYLDNLHYLFETRWGVISERRDHRVFRLRGGGRYVSLRIYERLDNSGLETCPEPGDGVD